MQPKEERKVSRKAKSSELRAEHLKRFELMLFTENEWKAKASELRMELLKRLEVAVRELREKAKEVRDG